MTTSTGGPAFPQIYINKEYNPHCLMTGMTLRDYFAAKAINKCPLNTHSDAAQWCYARADAMLKAREQK
jgi:hypothetical protein